MTDAERTAIDDWAAQAEGIYNDMYSVAKALALDGVEYCDVRLQYSEGIWRLWDGPACSDTDHNGSWGAGTLLYDRDYADCADLADQLADEAIESHIISSELSES